MKEWRWVKLSVIYAVHDRQLSDHGGGEGVRDEGLVEAAIHRPEALNHYGEPDAAQLAAAYAWSLLRNHGFVDGNKRTAWIAARLFLADNGFKLSFDPKDAIRTVEAAAASQITEEELASWFRERIEDQK